MMFFELIKLQKMFFKSDIVSDKLTKLFKMASQVQFIISVLAYPSNMTF